MLLGTHTPKLDDKGRLIVPAKFRSELGASVVITKGQERCLYVFSEEEFRRYYERMRDVPLTDRATRTYQRMFLAAASAESPDSQHRITIPPALRQYAGLERDLVMTGVGAHAEIWEAQAWDSYVDQNEDGYSDLEEEVVPGIF